MLACSIVVFCSKSLDVVLYCRVLGGDVPVGLGFFLKERNTCIIASPDLVLYVCIFVEPIKCTVQ